MARIKQGMRLAVRYDNIPELVGGALNLVPVPIGLAMFGMPLARSLLEATVVDPPGSARIGREIVSEAGMADRVHQGKPSNSRRPRTTSAWCPSPG
jgi:hypothetical protein